MREIVSTAPFHPRRLRIPALVNLLVALVVTGAAALAPPALAQAQSPPAATTVVERGSFYRFVVDLEYRGEVVTMNVVVGCNVRITNSRLTGQSVDAARLPPLYAVAMRDGKALLVQTPDACAGETTANGRFPADFLPIVILYDDAEFVFGVGYFSEDAYENPLSQLRFKGARVEAATAADWQAWRREGVANLLKPERLRGGTTLERKGFGAECHGMRRLPLPPAMSALVRRNWPESRPRYWRPDVTASEQLERRLWSNFDTDLERLYLGHAWRAYLVEGRMAGRGLPRRDGGGTRSEYRGQKFAAPLFPWWTDIGAPWLSPGKDELISELDVRGGATLGFLYCYDRPVSERVLDAILPGYSEKNSMCRIDGTSIDTDRSCLFDRRLFFERDEFVFAQHQVSIAYDWKEPP